LKLIKENVKIEWVDLGEGWDGDWDPDNPDDEPLLRFDVYRLDEKINDWVEIPDASYCTMFPANSPRRVRKKGLKFLMDEIFEPCSVGHSVKKLCERLSWIEPSWLPDEKAIINKS
jgi:hypothetical protein